jgi:hypothetical protein
MVSADEIETDTLMAAGISEVVRWPFDSTEIAAALKRCLAPSEDRLRLPIVVGRLDSNGRRNTLKEELR